MKALAQLAWGNCLRNRGRLFILVVLLCAAFLIKSATTLTQGQLARETSGAMAAATDVPTGSRAVVRWTASDGFLADIQSFFPPFYTKLPGQAECVWGYAEAGFGPGGEVTLVRLYPETGGSLVAPAARWASALEGRYPQKPDEIILPRGTADAAGLSVGERVTLTALTGPGQTQAFVLTGIYTPAGSGPVFDYALSTPRPEKEGLFNFALALDENTLGALCFWNSEQPRLVIGLTSPVDRAASVARDVYSSQSAAMNIGTGLVGAAVFIVLLVAFHERRREVAVYKMAGVDNVGVAQILAIELAIALAIAICLGVPIYSAMSGRLAGSQVVPPAVHALATCTSLLWALVVTAMGALYPVALTTVAAPSQLISGQKVFIFHRKQTLRSYSPEERE